MFGQSHAERDFRDGAIRDVAIQRTQCHEQPPKTEIWCVLYAQLRQADGKDNRNILLSELRSDYVDPDKVPRIVDKKWTKLMVANSLLVNLDAPATGTQSWTEAQIQKMLSQSNLAPDTRLSVLAVEMMPRYDQFIFSARLRTNQSVLCLMIWANIVF